MPEAGINFNSLEGDVPFDVSEAEKVAALAKRYDMSETDIKKLLDEETARVTSIATKFNLPEAKFRAALRRLNFMKAQIEIRKEVEEALAVESDLPQRVVSALLHDARQLTGGKEDEEDQKEREHAVRLAWKHDIPLFRALMAIKKDKEDKDDDAGVVATLAKRYQLSFAAVANLLRSARGLKVQLQIQGCMTIPELDEKLRLADERLAFAHSLMPRTAP